MSSLNKAADFPVEKKETKKNLQLEARAAARITDERECRLLHTSIFHHNTEGKCPFKVLNTGIIGSDTEGRCDMLSFFTQCSVWLMMGGGGGVCTEDLYVV